MNSEINSDVDLYAVESFTDGDSHANYEDRRWENGQSFLSQEEVVIVEEEEYNRDSSVPEYSYNESKENVDQPEQNPESTNAMHEQENSYSEVSNKAIEDNNERACSESSYNSEGNDQIQEFPKMHQIDSGFVVTPTAHSAEMSFVEPAEVGHVMSLPRRKEARWSSQFDEEIPVQGIANEVKVPSPRSVAIEYPAPTQIETQRAISPISENRETSVESAQPLTKKDNLDHLDLSEEKKKRFMYGCIPVNKKSRLICLGITFLFIAALAIVGYFFYPRYPEFHVTAINVKNGTHFNFTEVNLNANNLDFRFSLDMILDVVVLNHNLYHLKVDSIDLTAYIWANASEINNAGVLPTQEVFGKVNKTRITVDSSNRQQEIGHGIYSQQQTFLPGVNSTFHIPLRVEYSPNPEYGALNDPALNEILQLCQTERIPTRHTTIHYEAYNDISLLKMFGLTPNLRGEISINCPFQGEDYSAFLQAIGKGSH
ncbi:hypothetical protein HK103_007693 [Boothiomyces macroporosus]|uniref:Uncharacterized protein n=1 Tax=Boothiomyces macroporosus TaxID=261099 RepID=A0AAD5UF12_9FUNG|nr:hypothetical protein HK103_007693 [Boothiomyces macroporosus]